jgi:hypothetical protein
MFNNMSKLKQIITNKKNENEIIEFEYFIKFMD